MNLVKKASTRLFFIRRLKKLGASKSVLKESYILFIRPILEMCAPLWTGALTQTKTQFLKQVQRSFCKILFSHESYERSIEKLNLQYLHKRRIILSKRTSNKMSKNDKFKHLFIKVNQLSTRSSRIFKEPEWRSIRYGYSAIPFFIRLINGEEPQVHKK